MSPRPQPTRVGWCTVAEHCSDLLFEVPEPLKPAIPCPAIGGWMAQTFLVRAPYDVHLLLERGDGGLRLRWGEGAPANDVYDSFALVSPALWPAPHTPVVMWDLRNLFVADRPTVLESTAPFLHAEALHWPGVLVPQRLRLDVAARPLNWPFLWQQPGEPLRIRRGDPLQYVHLHGADFETGFQLEAIPYTAAVARAVADGGPPGAGLLPPRDAPAQAVAGSGVATPTTS